MVRDGGASEEKCKGKKKLVSDSEVMEEVNKSLLVISDIDENLEMDSQTKDKIQELMSTESLDDLNLLDLVKRSEVKFSWRMKRPDLICVPVKQYKHDCYAIALHRAYLWIVKLNGLAPKPLTSDLIVSSLPAKHVVSGEGIDRLESAIPFMRQYVDAMEVIHKPRGYEQDQAHLSFEKLIEDLVEKVPVAISILMLPSMDSFYNNGGKGIYIPDDIDCEARNYEKFNVHCILLKSHGFEMHDGKIVKYWEAQDSKGIEIGDEGFIKFARNMCLITRVVKLGV